MGARCVACNVWACLGVGVLRERDQGVHAGAQGQGRMVAIWTSVG